MSEAWTTAAYPPLTTRPAVEAQRRFVILGHERTASMLLSQSLNEHPHVVCLREPFNPTPEKRASAGLWGGRRWSDAEDPVGFTERFLFSAPEGRETPVQGFKVFFHHCRKTPEHERLWARLQGDEALRVIFLTRRNLAASYISMQRASRIDVWNIEATELTPEGYNTPLEVDPEKCLRYVRTRIEGMDWLRQGFAGHPALDLTFEEATGDYDATIARLWDFLEVPPITLDPPLRPMSRKPLREVLLNYDELKAALAESELSERAWLP